MLATGTVDMTSTEILDRAQIVKFLDRPVRLLAGEHSSLSGLGCFATGLCSPRVHVCVLFGVRACMLSHCVRRIRNFMTRFTGGR